VFLANGHWVTFDVAVSQTTRGAQSEPIDKLLLSWDNGKGRLKVVVKNTAVGE
jgi:hypothetical protein